MPDALISFDAVKTQTTEEYFNGNYFSIDAFNKKYVLSNGETYVQALKRVCDFVASVEETKEKQKHQGPCNPIAHNLPPIHPTIVLDNSKPNQ